MTATGVLKSDRAVVLVAVTMDQIWLPVASTVTVQQSLAVAVTTGLPAL